VSVSFGRYPTWRYAECTGGNNERPVRTREYLAKDHDGTSIGIGSTLEIARERDVVFESEMDHAV
jgi:hypothetical protein